MTEIPVSKEPSASFVDAVAEKALNLIFARAGIEVSGSTLVVNDRSFYRDVLTTGSLGLGDSYIEGKWDSEAIDEIVFRLLSLGVHQTLAPVYDIAREVKRRVMNLQTRECSRQVIEKHYDLPAEFYEHFLDPYFQYTCARFEGTDDLDEAQKKKMDDICKKVKLKEGDKVLDIGGGWGGLAQFMAENYGARPTVVTLSKTQAEHIKRTHGDKKIAVQLCDYRDIPRDLGGSFDIVTAVGVLEHIGHDNYEVFMKMAQRNLKPDGKFFIHTLYTPQSRSVSNPWLHKHIFPNGELSPRITIEENLEAYFEPDKAGDQPTFEDITANYFPTLHAWVDRLKSARESGKVQMSEREFRKWIYYFMSCAGAIKARHMRVGQFLYRKSR